MGYYAHSVENQSKINWQTLQEHLTSVGNLAANFASAFNAQDQAQIAGLLHDSLNDMTPFEYRNTA